MWRERDRKRFPLSHKKRKNERKIARQIKRTGAWEETIVCVSRGGGHGIFRIVLMKKMKDKGEDRMKKKGGNDWIQIKGGNMVMVRIRPCQQEHWIKKAEWREWKKQFTIMKIMTRVKVTLLLQIIVYYLEGKCLFMQLRWLVEFWFPQRAGVIILDWEESVYCVIKPSTERMHI